MNRLNTLKTAAINAVKNDQRLIGDVAKEFGISSRKLYQWLSEKPNSKAKPTRRKQTNDVVSMKIALKLLESEVSQLKNELKQYHITETLKDGRIKLSFEKSVNYQKAV